MSFPSSSSYSSKSATTHLLDHDSGRRHAQSYPRCPLQRVGRGEEEDLSERLQFALAVALSRGDQSRISWLRDQINHCGISLEEPGT